MKRTTCKRKLKYAFVHLVRIAESLLVVCSLGHLDAEWYSTLIFSEWCDDIDNG